MFVPNILRCHGTNIYIAYVKLFIRLKWVLDIRFDFKIEEWLNRKT